MYLEKVLQFICYLLYEGNKFCSGSETVQQIQKKIFLKSQLFIIST